MTPRITQPVYRGGCEPPWRTQIFVGKAYEFKKAKVTLKVILKVTDNVAIR